MEIFQYHEETEGFVFCGSRGLFDNIDDDRGNRISACNSIRDDDAHSVAHTPAPPP